MTAVVNMGKAGKIELGQNSTFTLTSDGNSVGGDLTAGSITVLDAMQNVSVKTLTGEVGTIRDGRDRNGQLRQCFEADNAIEHS